MICRKHPEKTMVITVLFVSLLLRIQLAMPAPTQTFPGSSWMGYPDQPQNLNFLNDLQNFLDTLILQASKTGFYNFSFGEAPNRVYGHYLCRGDLGGQDCSDCVRHVKDTIQRVIPCLDTLPGWQNYFMNSEFQYDHCMLRYSKSFTGKMDKIYSNTRVWNPRNGIWDRIWFAQVLNVTLSHLPTQAANDGSGKRFATKVAKIKRFESLYTMGQCTWDLTPSDCNKCLTKMIENLLRQQYNSSWSSGSAYSPSCMVRYETFPFFNSTTVMLPSSSFPPLAVSN